MRDDDDRDDGGHERHEPEQREGDETSGNGPPPSLSNGVIGHVMTARCRVDAWGPSGTQ